MRENSAISNGHGTVAVVGLGKIGLPLAVYYALHGWRVIGCDINPQVVEMVNAGQSHIKEEPELAIEVPRLVRNGWLTATTNTSEAVGQSSVVVVVVPVLVDERHQVMFDAIDAASAVIGAGLKRETLVIYETTLPVGTTAQRLRRILEQKSQLLAGQDFSLAFSPERVRSGRIFQDLRTYPKIIGGIDERSTARAETFYRSTIDAEIIAMPSTNEAEYVKLIENIYRDVNIALANEFALYADARGLDVMVAINAANTQPLSHIHKPGVGVGGHCIPVYPYFLINDLFENEMQQKSLQQVRLLLPCSARQVNDSMAEYAVQRVEEVTGSLDQQPALIMGVAYRGDVRETAFTSAKLLQKALLQCGARVYTSDPLYSDEELRSMGYTPLPDNMKCEISAIIVQSDHKAYHDADFGAYSRCQVVLDGRNALSHAAIESLGIRYITIGDGGQSAKARTDSRVPALTGAAGFLVRRNLPQ